ncbi:MAG: hypothetical protein ABW118_16760 [Candidatus Thiodiazotropha sp.]
MDRVAGCCGLDGRRHAGDAAAHNQNVLVEGLLAGGGGLCHGFELGARHADVVFRHLLGGLAVLVRIGTNPDDALAQVGAGQGHIGKVEGLDLGALGTGGDHDVGDILIGDVVFDYLHTLGGAEHLVLFAALHLAVTGSDGFQLTGVQALAQATAGADISSKFLFVSHSLNPPSLLRD